MKNSSAQSGMIDDEFQEAAAFKVAELSDTQTKLGLGVHQAPVRHPYRPAEK